MIRIAYLTDLLNMTGGGGSNADRLCRELHGRDGIDLTTVHSGGTGLPDHMWNGEGDYLRLYPTSLSDGIDELDPDIVFVHSFNVRMFEWLADYADEHPETALVYRAGVNTVEQWLTLYQHQSPKRVTTPVGSLDAFDAIFAPSYAAAERIKLNYGDAAPPLIAAPCTIDYKSYAPTPFREDGTLRVVMASRIAPNTYALAPLLALRRLAEKYDIEMEILSAGDSEYIQTVFSVADDIDAVEIVGNVAYEEVQGHLEWADVVCVPTAAQQAVPTVAVEAMAAGNVVLCAPFYAVNEEETLVRVPFDHPPAWYDALADIAGNRDDALDRIRAGLDAAAEYDTERVVTDAYMPIFHSLVAEQEMGADVE